VGYRFASLLSIDRDAFQALTIGVLLCAGLYLASLYSYLLFHIIVEGFSIVIAVSLFLIAWNTRHLAKNNYVLFLSIAFLFVGLIDFVHTLAYKGMGIFTGYDANLPTQLWIAARYLQGLSLLAAPWFIDRKLNVRAVLGFYLSVTILLLAAVFSGALFPTCFVEGTGLTPFKIVSEYIISFILLSSLALLLHHRDKFDPHILRLIVWSILFTIVSELAFTFYVSVYGLSNLIGHYFKILAFYLIYRAIIVTGLKNPYRLLFHDLEQNREELQIIIDSSPIMIFYKDLENRFVRVNKTLAEATGLPREEIEGRTGADIYPDQGAGYWENDREVIASGKPRTGIIEPINTASGMRWLQTDKIPYRDMEGNIVGIIGFSIDITERKQAEEALRENEKLLTSYLENAPEGIYISDLEGTFLYGNRMCEEITGYRREELIGKNFLEVNLLSENSLSEVSRLLQANMEGKSTGPDEIELISKEGHLIPVEIDTSVVQRMGQRIVLAFVRDITERKQAEEKIQQMAYHDSLTGLANRHGFLALAGQQLKLSDRTKKGVLLFFADLDGMKEINDTLGHKEGDNALIDVAAVLNETFRSSDIIARMGGDEFAVLAIDMAEENADIQMTRLQDRFDRHNGQADRRYRLSLSVGCSCYDPENPRSIDELMAQADKRMYEQKRSKKS